MPPHKPLADLGVGIAIAAPTWAWLSNANEVAQFAASVVAVLSGLSASVYYIARFIYIRRAYKSKPSDSVDKK